MKNRHGVILIAVAFIILAAVIFLSSIKKEIIPMSENDDSTFNRIEVVYNVKNI